MAERRVTTKEDAVVARERIIAASTVAPVGRRDPGPIDFERNIVAVDEDDGVMLCELAPNGVWYMQDLWGHTESWLRLGKIIIDELITRGHGRTPLRFRQLDDVPAMNAVLAAWMGKLVVDDDSGRELWEVTANGAKPLLERTLSALRP